MSTSNDAKTELAPKGIDTLQNPISYHYCSTSTFLSIISNKTIWLSDINTMNDFSERHWAYDRFIEAANLVIGQVGRDFIDRIDSVMHHAGYNNLSLVASFSADGDVLSQWKSYAEDGTGVAVGFDSHQLKNLAVRTVQIEYQKEKQTDHHRTILLAAHQLFSNLGDNEKKDFIPRFAAKLFYDLSCFKNPAFQEEKELRLIRVIGVSRKETDWYLHDGGGNGEKYSRKKLPIKFRAKNGGVVSYIELPLRSLNENAIKHIVMGPKSVNSGNEISMALTANGFTGCKITKSEATYR